MSLDLISQLEEQFPVSRQVNIEGFPKTLWVWRMETEQILAMAGSGVSAGSDPSQIVEFGLRLIGMAIGDENGPGVFDNDRARAFLRRQPNIVMALSNAVQEFNELNGPSDERKKSSETMKDFETSSPSQGESDSTTQNESSSDSAPEL